MPTRDYITFRVVWEIELFSQAILCSICRRVAKQDSAGVNSNSPAHMRVVQDNVPVAKVEETRLKCIIGGVRFRDLLCESYVRVNVSLFRR